MNSLIVKVALPIPLRRCFDYLLPQGIDYTTLKKGMRVLVPFQSRTLVGTLFSIEKNTAQNSQKLKQIHAILDQEPLICPDILKLAEWASDYYHVSLGEALIAALPKYLRQDKPLKPAAVSSIAPVGADVVLQLNSEQQDAVEQIVAQSHFNVTLLEGVTGSGKTEVYLRVIETILSKQKQVLVLVPEISLTPQTIARFQQRFSLPIVTLHSGLTEKQRALHWLAAQKGEAKIIIGTRSAIFSSIPNLGLIIIDEEHDHSFKQQDRFRYHARDVAIMRARLNNVPIILGSATPSLESMLNAKRQRYQLIKLSKRAGKAALPTYQLVNIKNQKLQDGLSDLLIKSMHEHLVANNQVLLFLNRRGYAPVYYCTACQTIFNCERCDAKLVYYQQAKKLKCHHCDKQIKLPSCCLHCNSEELQAIGVGTQRIEERLTKLFPDVPIIRIDKDSTRKKDALHQLLTEIKDTPQAILLGTQILAKGHHFPNVTLVGVIDADGGLFSADFRACEQMGQLLLQVSGRAGRVDKAGRVMIQTRQIDHPLLNMLLNNDYQVFADHLLQEREANQLPPFMYFALFRAESYQQQNAETFLHHLKAGSTSYEVEVLGPVSALRAKRKGLHCQQLLIKAKKRSMLNHYLKDKIAQLDALPKKHLVKWTLDVDPIEVV